MSFPNYFWMVRTNALDLGILTSCPANLLNALVLIDYLWILLDYLS